jgi:hypothetical protein
VGASPGSWLFWSNIVSKLFNALNQDATADASALELAQHHRLGMPPADDE